MLAIDKYLFRTFYDTTLKGWHDNLGFVYLKPKMVMSDLSLTAEKHVLTTKNRTLMNPLKLSSLWNILSVLFLTLSANGKKESLNSSSELLIIICCVYVAMRVIQGALSLPIFFLISLRTFLSDWFMCSAVTIVTWFLEYRI